MWHCKHIIRLLMLINIFIAVLTILRILDSNKRDSRVSSCLHNEQHVLTPPHSHGKEVEVRAEPDGKGRTSTYLPMNQFAPRMFSATPFLVLFLELISFLAISQ